MTTTTAAFSKVNSFKGNDSVLLGLSLAFYAMPFTDAALEFLDLKITSGS